MTSEKEITSTEKLLNVIRGRSDPETGRRELLSEGRGVFSGRSLRQKGPSLGIDISHNRIRVVKVEPVPHKNWRLVDYASVPIPPDYSRGTQQFKGFLKDTLRQLCGSPGTISLWAILPMADVEVRNISVPKVARKELHNVVLWSAKKESPFEEEHTVFDFEIQGDVIESGIEKLGVLFYAAPKKEVDELNALFTAAGYPLTGVTVAPLALQNIFRTGWIPAHKRTVASLYIGRGWSRIDIFSEGNLVMTRGIKAGLNSMAESLIDEYAKWREQAAASKEQTKISGYQETVIEMAPAPEAVKIEQARELLQALSNDSKSDDEPARTFGLDNERVFHMITPALERLVRQVERTFEHYVVNMGRESIGAIYVSTAMDISQSMVDYISSQLGIPGDVLDPLDPDHIAVEGLTAPETPSERTAFVPALGVALSSASHTLNLIFTRQDKARRKKHILTNVTAAAVLCAVMVLSVGWYLWLDRVADQKSTRVALLEESLARDIPVDETLLMRMAADFRSRQEAQAETRNRYLAVALLGEVLAITPETIKLMSFGAELGRGAPGAPPGRSVRTATMDGFVTGGHDDLETDLIDYVMRLQKSPLFDRVVINTRSSQLLEGEDVLRFSLAAALNGVAQ